MAPVASTSAKYNVTISELLVNLRKAFNDLTTTKDCTVWMDIIRTCRQPQVMWEVDYIEPRPEMDEVIDLIRKSENCLCSCKNVFHSCFNNCLISAQV